ncbi:MAG: bifunctional glutamine synthetase adenylyltransferase/deadenyltransferase, partial [Endozoicomonas sp.]
MESFKAVFDQKLASSELPHSVQQIVGAHWNQFLERHPSFDLTTDPTFINELIYCWAGSDFSAQQCIRYPEWLELLYTDHDNLPVMSISHGDRLDRILKKITSEEDLNKALRLYRNKEILRIIWLDLNRKVPMSHTTEDMSALADTCIDRALDWLYRDTCQIIGTPYGTNIPEDEPIPQKMIVLGMGKLGARDLNLSSDIDLMFTFPCQGETRGSKKAVTNQEFFIRLGQ